MRPDYRESSPVSSNWENDDRPTHRRSRIHREYRSDGDLSYTTGSAPKYKHVAADQESSIEDSDREFSVRNNLQDEDSRDQIESTNDDTDVVKTPHVSITPLQPLEDVTLHMSLDVQHNLESYLEELSKFRRLGHFKAAFYELEEKITPFLKNRYILVQYGQVLMEGKRYEELSKLAKKYPPKDTNSIIELNWKALLKRTGALTDIDFGSIENMQRLLVQTNIANSQFQISSTELDALLLSWSPSLWLSDGSKPCWRLIYKHLYANRRAWELRDLLHTLLFYEAPSIVLSRFIPQGEHSDASESRPYQKLYDDLNMVFQDETSTLAMLDLFTSISFAYMSHPNSQRQVDDCLNIGRDFANRSLGYGTQNLKSRPYLRFLIAEVRSKSYDRTGVYYDNIIFRGTRRGKVLEFSTIFPELSVPIYAPVDDEVPKWKPQLKPETQESMATISLVLKAAEELEDVELQAGCLLEFIYHETKNTKPILTRLQRLVLLNGDHFYHRNLLLFSYMLTESSDERKALRADILIQGEYISSSIEPQATRYKILASLAPNRQEKNIYTQRAEKKALQKYSGTGSSSPSHNPRPPDFGPWYEQGTTHDNQSYVMEPWETTRRWRRELTRRDPQRRFVSTFTTEIITQRQRSKAASDIREERIATSNDEPGSSRLMCYARKHNSTKEKGNDEDIQNEAAANNWKKAREEYQKRNIMTKDLHCVR